MVNCERLQHVCCGVIRVKVVKRGALKMSRSDIFLTGCSIPNPLCQKNKGHRLVSSQFVEKAQRKLGFLL